MTWNDFKDKVDQKLKELGKENPSIYYIDFHLPESDAFEKGYLMIWIEPQLGLAIG